MKYHNNNAITLARVSTKEQEEEGYSVDAQTEYLVKYCEGKELKVVKHFKIAETASKPERRKEFQLMVDYLKKHKIEHLVVEKVDRLTRNSKSAILIDDWLDEDLNRHLHLPKNGLILHKGSTSQDRFMWDIYVAVAKQYANNLREEVKKGVLEKLRQGWYPGTRPPIGYKHTGDKGHKIQIIDTELAPLVKLAFELYDTGNYSIKTLALELEVQGLSSQRSKPLSKSYIHYMLRDKFYVGIMTWLGVEYGGKYEALIDEDLFERVQARLSSGTTPQVEKHFTLLKGKTRCEGCGAIVSWYQQKGRWYGECKSQKACEVRGCARQDIIEEELTDYFGQLIVPSPAIIAWVKKELRQSHVEETEQYRASVQQLTNKHRRVDEQIRVLYEDRLDGRISPELYDQKFKEKTAERDELAKSLERITKQNTEYIEQAIDILDLTQNAAEIFRTKPVEEQRILIGDIFSGIVLNGKHMTVTWRPETEVVRKAVEKTKRLDRILEPSSDRSKMVLSNACRSVWLPGPESCAPPLSYPGLLFALDYFNSFTLKRLLCSIKPALISLWQLAHTRIHLSNSSWTRCHDRECPLAPIPNVFEAGLM